MHRVKNKVSYFQLLTFLIFIFNAKSVCASVPALEREVSLSIKNENLATVLKKIEEQSGLIFSYSPQLLKDVALISIQVKNKSVREVLSLILPTHISFKAKNSYIILKEKDVAKSQKSQTISGYVYDAQTDKKVPNVTVYDKGSLQSATSDEYGYYSLTVPVSNSSVSVNRINYKDTSIAVRKTDSDAITNISLQPESDSIIRKDSAKWQKTLNQINSQAQHILKKWSSDFMRLNIEDSINRDIQFSFLPFIGTNHRLSGNVYNKFSFNILGGYSRGTKAFELGGLFNLDQENVYGVQIGGLINVVGDSLNGVQIGGLTNINGKKTKGVQIAGLLNLNGGSVDGLQIAGLVNYNKSFHAGTSIAGLLNYNQHARGLQVAGLSNVNDTASAVLIAGFINRSQFHEDANAFSGCMNVAQSGTTKLQVAPCFNKTAHVTGLQLGMVNVSDTASGVPIGLFSFVKKGVHQLEVSVDETQYFNLNFRTGVPEFYNVFYAGIQPFQGNVLWSLGYGLGTSFRVKGNLRSDITLSAKHLSIGSFTEAPSDRIQVYWGLEYKINSKFSIAGGPVMNLCVSSPGYFNYTASYEQIAPKYAGTATSPNNANMRYWVGGQVSLRFF